MPYILSLFDYALVEFLFLAFCTIKSNAYLYGCRFEATVFNITNNPIEFTELKPTAELDSPD